MRTERKRGLAEQISKKCCRNYIDSASGDMYCSKVSSEIMQGWRSPEGGPGSNGEKILTEEARTNGCQIPDSRLLLS